MKNRFSLPAVQIFVLVLTLSLAESAWAQNVSIHIQALASADPSARIQAAQAIGQLRSPAAVPHLQVALNSDPSPEVRGWVLRALAQIGTPQAIAVVRAAAQNDTDERVRSLAASLLPQPPQVQVNAQVGVQPQPQVVQQPQQQVVVQPQPQVVMQPQPVVQPRRSSGRGLIVSGWVLFGAGYFFSAVITTPILTASYGDELWPGYLPLVGPFIAIARANQLSDTVGREIATGLITPFLVIQGLLQVAGVAMAIPGHIRRSRSRDMASNQRQIAFVPSGPNGTPGLSLAGVF